jgi:hypothetical protein
MNTTTETHAAATPEPEGVALHLAELAAELPGFDNADRERLANVAELLRGAAPNIEAALAQARAGVRHAIRPGYIEQRPETWLLCAVAHLLAPASAAVPAGFAKLPKSDDLGVWVDVLGEAASALTAEADVPPPPEPGSAEAVARALQLQGLRLWLTSAMHLRVQADAGLHAGNDPDAVRIDGGAEPPTTH